MYVSMCVCTYVRMYICMYVRTYVRMYLCMYDSLSVSVCVCIRARQGMEHMCMFVLILAYTSVSAVF